MGVGTWVLGPWVYPNVFGQTHVPTEKLFFLCTQIHNKLRAFFSEEMMHLERIMHITPALQEA